MSTKYVVMCGVPDEECSGFKFPTDQHFIHKKAHASHEEAFRCYARHLAKTGYRRISSREFQKGDEPVLILTRKSQFGGRLRSGKLQERYMPKRGNGVIIG